MHLKFYRLPTASFPRIDLLPYVYKEAIVIAFVIAAIHFSLCKMFGTRHGYKTDNNQVSAYKAFFSQTSFLKFG